MTVDVIEYLRSKGVSIKPATNNNIHISCPFCGEDPAKRGRCYIDPNSDPPGLFTCFLCGKSGAINALRKAYGDPPLKDEEAQAESLRTLQVWKAAANYYHDALDEHVDVLKWWTEDRGLTPATVDKHLLGYGAPGLLDYLRSHGFTTAEWETTGLIQKGNEFLQGTATIPYIAQGHVTLIRGRALSNASNKYLTPTGQKGRLFNVDATFAAENDVVITEGEIDCMTLEQNGFAAVGVAGAQGWQETWGSYFTHVRRAYVVFDNDMPGQRGAQKVINTLGPKARIVQMPEEVGKKNDPNEWFRSGHTVDEFRLLLKDRSDSILLTVHQAFAEWQEMQGIPGLKFGIEALDFRLAPGGLPGQLLVYLAKTGVGKQEPVSAEVPTPTGFTKIGDLQPGDRVFGSNGRPTTVLGVFPQGVRRTFRVSFSDGTSRLCGDNHLWQVLYRYGKKREWTPTVKSTLDLYEGDLRRGPEWRWRIPLCDPVQYPERDLPIEPYTVGSLIANGGLTGSSAILTTPDKHVVERVRQSYLVRQIEVDTKYCPRYVVHGVIAPVRSLGLAVRSRDKRIPEAYLQASVRQRVALLQGLMDGDASSSNKGRTCVTYYTTSQQLADDVVELVSSLGGTAVPFWSDRRDEGKPLECRLTIMLPSEIKPFSSPRKQQGVGIYKTGPARAIVGIEEVDPEDSVCIAVDAPDHLYLTGREYIVTHNTILLLNLFHLMSMVNPDLRILFVSLEQTRSEWFERARRIYRFHHPDHNDQRALDYFDKRMMIVDRNRLSEQGLVDVIHEYSDEVGAKPDVLAVDYLGYWARSYKGEAYERTTAAVMALKAIAKDERIFTITPHQVNRMTKRGEEIDDDAGRESGAVEETADFLFGLWSEDHRRGTKEESKTGRVTLKITKSRHGGVDTRMDLQFAPLSLAMVPVTDHALAARAREELHWHQCRDTFDLAVYRHATGDDRLVVPPQDLAAWEATLL